MSEFLMAKAISREDEPGAEPGSTSPAAESLEIKRRLPVGAEVQSSGGVHFRLWAQSRQRASVQITNRSGKIGNPQSLQPEGNGYFSALISNAQAGDHYWYLLDSNEHRIPDPASRFPPEGQLGPSEIVDPSAYAWKDNDWRGVKLPGPVIYELHLGTFTSEGTWAAASRELPELA